MRCHGSTKNDLIFHITMKRKQQGWSDEAIHKMHKKLRRTTVSDLKALHKELRAVQTGTLQGD